MARVGFRIHRPTKILLGFPPALLGQLGGNIRFVFGRDFPHEMSRLFGAGIPGDKLFRARRNLLRQISFGPGQLLKRESAVRSPRLGASVLLRQILGLLFEPGVSNAVDSFPVTFNSILCGCFHCE